MRLKAVKLGDYDAAKGLQLDVNTSLVWQFLVSEGGSIFLDWLTPIKEYVKPKVENKLNFFNLANLLEQGDVVTEEVKEFKINPSVCAVGVSLDEYETDKSYWLSLGVPVFISVNLHHRGLQGVEFWLKNTPLDSNITYVLDLDLKYTEVQKVVSYLNFKGISEDRIRLVGDCVFKYKGQNYCGLFSPSFAKAYKLEFVYDSEPHKATQVFLSKDSSKEVPIEDCKYSITGRR